jgi:hypothetical protein
MNGLTPEAITLLRQVCEDAADLLSCNCSYTSGTAPEDRCDGTCTHSMALRGMAAIDALPPAQPDSTIQCGMGRYTRGHFRRCNRPAHHTGPHRYGERKVV